MSTQFSLLPNEIWNEILILIELKDLFRFLSVCKVN